MSLPQNEDCVPETPLPDTRKRVHETANLHSHKRRKISFAGEYGGHYDDIGATDTPRLQMTSSVDRFVSVRPKTFLPLHITPRTRRISKEFGLTDERILNFNECVGKSPSRRVNENTIGLLRQSASSLFQKSPIIHPSSVTENLSKRKECLAILDTPGVSRDPDAYPISWSQHNLIAVVCALDIFYQNVQTKTVSQLCRSVNGSINAIQWAGVDQPNYLGAGNRRGMVLIWDASGTNTRDQPLRSWQGTHFDPVKCLNWNQSVLVAGMDSGDLSIIDTRVPNIVSKFRLHNYPITGAKWSFDGNLLATGDSNGIAYIWDHRAGKPLLNTEATTKIRHKGKVKAIAWCPWQPDMLATGTTSPEGKIRIWNTSSISVSTPSPVHTIPLNTSVTSLHWSPHCKELLSTHGASFTPVLHSGIQNQRNHSRPKYAKSPLMNSIAVHQYPSCKRLMTLSNAHTSALTHSCLGPSGESVFTVCPNEETIKLWKVWTAQKSLGKKESAFDRYAIR